MWMQICKVGFVEDKVFKEDEFSHCFTMEWNSWRNIKYIIYNFTKLNINLFIIVETVLFIIYYIEIAINGIRRVLK